jgi:hypothetical protein
MFQGVDGIVLDNNHNLIFHANEFVFQIFIKKYLNFPQ